VLLKAHRIFLIGTALALCGAFANAQEQSDGFFAGLKLRGAVQADWRKDNLMPVYTGFGIECGYQFAWGRLSAEAGFLYKAGRQYKDDLTKMKFDNNVGYNPEWSVDSRKNQVDGVVLRLAYEKPLNGFSVRGGIQLGSLKFRQEYIADVTDDENYEDTYNGVIDKGNMSISPFVGISFPFLTHHFIELNVVALNYKAINYVHIGGTVLDWGAQNTQTGKDYIAESTTFTPHIELTFGFRF
jgi:hypothetical protein